jgi:hypothetical protein
MSKIELSTFSTSGFSANRTQNVYYSEITGEICIVQYQSDIGMYKLEAYDSVVKLVKTKLVGTKTLEDELVGYKLVGVV